MRVAQLVKALYWDPTLLWGTQWPYSWKVNDNMQWLIRLSEGATKKKLTVSLMLFLCMVFISIWLDMLCYSHCLEVCLVEDKLWKLLILV